MTDAWTDLVYHALAHIPLAAGDASSLYWPRYVEWYAERLQTVAGDVAQRTLPDDAPMLGALYDAAPGALYVQSFAGLYDDVRHFRDVMGEHSGAFVPAGTRNPRFARRLGERVGVELIELFQIALWSELRGGFCDAHEAVLVPLTVSGGRDVAAHLDALADEVPELGSATIDHCLPLGVHGRLTAAPDTPTPEIHVGAPAADLGVDVLDVALQAAHEHTVWLAQRAMREAGHAPAPVSTRPADEAYVEHLRTELTALSIGARCLAEHGRFGEAWRRWLDGRFPGGGESMTTRLPWCAESRSLPDLTGALWDGALLDVAGRAALDAVVPRTH